MDQQDDWVHRVLGVDVHAAPEGAAPLSASAARAQEAAPVSRGRVNFRKVQLQWRAAEVEASAQLGAFTKALLADPEVKAHPQFAALAAAMGDVRSLIPTFSDDLADELDRLDNAATPNDRRAARDAALKVIGEYDTDLAGAEGLRDLQELADDEYGGMAFFSGLQAALAELRRAVANAA